LRRRLSFVPTNDALRRTLDISYHNGKFVVKQPQRPPEWDPWRRTAKSPRKNEVATFLTPRGSAVFAPDVCHSFHLRFVAHSPSYRLLILVRTSANMPEELIPDPTLGCGSLASNVSDIFNTQEFEALNKEARENVDPTHTPRHLKQAVDQILHDLKPNIRTH
jgi:hypothetical protein